MSEWEVVVTLYQNAKEKAKAMGWMRDRADARARDNRYTEYITEDMSAALIDPRMRPGDMQITQIMQS